VSPSPSAAEVKDLFSYTSAADEVKDVCSYTSAAEVRDV
jgi:hypothetical protein